MRGRKPIPDQLKALTGNPGGRPLDDDPVAVDAELPPMPDHIQRDGLAAEEWDRCGAELVKMGVIGAVDMAMFACYCSAWSRYVRAEEALRELGTEALLVRTPNGYPIQNPYIGIANKAMEQIKAFGEQFGMSAVARVRVSRVNQPMLPGLDDQFDNYLGHGPAN